MTYPASHKLLTELRKIIPELPEHPVSVSIHLDAKSPPMVVVVSEPYAPGSFEQVTQTFKLEAVDAA